MKGGSRSNRTATTTTEPADDWGGDGSWTVDCICGVTFDDGEEMVNCDDCGVWVHTRCSRFVKADKSFACHKCKSNNTAETEVAQLLVELPTKTLHHRHPPPPPPKKIRLSVPLWTDRPLEDRVHVQGVSGDHTSLFPDPNPFPVVISSRLWNSCGYIPKTFNFRYSEFPCWSENSIDPPPTPPPAAPATAVFVSLTNKIPSVKPTKRPRQHSRDRPANKKSKLAATTPLPAVLEARANRAPSNARLTSAINLEISKRSEDKLTPSPPEDRAVTNSLDKSASENKKEGLVLAVDESQTAHPKSPTCTSDKLKSKPLTEDVTNSASKCTNTELNGNSEAVIPSGHFSNDTKSDLHFDNPKGVLASQRAGTQHEHVPSPDQECKGSKSREGVTNASKPLEQDEKDSKNGLEAVGGCQVDRKDEVTKKQKLECEGSNSSMEVHKSSRDSKDVSKGAAGQTPQPNGAVPPPPSNQKMVSAGKSSTATAIVFSRSNHSSKSKSGGSQITNLVSKRLIPSSCLNAKKEHAPVDLSKNEEKRDKPMSTLRDNQKPHLDSSLKASQPSRTVLKCYASVGKDSLRHSSSKLSSVDSSLVSSSATKPAEALPSEHALHEKSKNIVSGGLKQTESVPQSNVQPSSKSNQSSTGHPTVKSSSPAGLSDEELALLLHQELNSSPRVPRVPRVRNAGSLPQLSSATAANMLMKRTSTSGGKDKNTFSRRKNRDAHKEGSRNLREQDSEASKVDRVPSSLDTSKKADAFTLTEANTNSKVKKNREKMSSSTANSSPVSSGELKPSSARADNPDDEAGANKNSDLTCRTLPGLIAEIMGAGRRMAYEELCNAVLPHWPNLRKHNGERYAYSSHSQAVLDCLRNRTEWARLVDRGPKTSSGRKKRKVDADPLSSDSEDGEDKNLKEGESKSFESNKEEYPKGLRKARKRRRPAPQGRSVKDDKKRRKVEIGSSSDSGTSSNSSEDSASSEDDSQGSEMDVANTDVSLSSQ